MIKNQRLKESVQKYLLEETIPQFRKEIEDLWSASQEKELLDRFKEHLSFGTAGMRGLLGGGFSYFNGYNALRVTQALAHHIYLDHLIRRSGRRPKVVIGYDSRHYSKELSTSMACLLVGQDIVAYLFKEPRPTPFVPFVVRNLKADFGVMLTASHNSKEYNGYKVYGKEGYPLAGLTERTLIEQVAKVERTGAYVEESELLLSGRVQFVTPKFDEAYEEEVLLPSLRDLSLIQNKGKKLSILHSALHGVGGTVVPLFLRRLGFNVFEVEEQKEPNGDFPTIAYPNPEFMAPWTMAFKQAKKQKPTLILLNDPDADRLGVAIYDSLIQDYLILSGNQVGGLLLDYLAEQEKARSKKLKDYYFINTIVTSLWQKRIASYHGVEHHEVLTGFKWLMDKSKELGEQNFLFATEESIGYAASPVIKDKDGVLSAALVAEMVLSYQEQGKSLNDRLNELYKRIAYVEDAVINHEFVGKIDVMGQRLDQLRAVFVEGIKGSLYGALKGTPLEGLLIVAVYDLKQQKRLYFDTRGMDVPKKEVEDLFLPVSDVLQLFLKDKTRITLRPSGTEPKMKIYFSVPAQGPFTEQEKQKTQSRLANYQKMFQSWLATS